MAVSRALVSLNEVDRDLACRVAAARHEQGFSREAMAQALNVSLAEYGYIEAGRVRISARMIVTLSVILNRPIAWFFDQSSKPVTFPSQKACAGD